MWDIIIPIVTFIGGVASGGFGAYHLFKNQMANIQNDPAQMQAIAKSMGINMNQKQMNQMTRQMKKGTPNGNKGYMPPANGKKKKK